MEKKCWALELALTWSDAWELAPRTHPASVNHARHPPPDGLGFHLVAFSDVGIRWFTATVAILPPGLLVPKFNFARASFHPNQLRLKP
jgi:hypothetical protein